MKADLHIHSSFSYDAISSPKEIVDFAIEKGINCICITDHGEIKGAIEAMKYGFDKDILVVPGIEVVTSLGDLIGINIKRKIPENLTMKEAIKEIRKAGGIAIIPHPFRKMFMGFRGSEKDLKVLQSDAIEGFNASDIFMSSNNRAYNFCLANNFSFTAGSDSHRKEFIGRGYIEFVEKINSEKDLISAIMDKRIKIGGQRLTFLEMVKNSLNSDVRDIITCFKSRFFSPKNFISVENFDIIK